MTLLRMERDRANAYLELNEALLMSLGPDRRVLEVNARGSELLGMAREEIHGRDWIDFFPDDYERERARILLDSALANDSSREREFDAIVHGEQTAHQPLCDCPTAMVVRRGQAKLIV